MGREIRDGFGVIILLYHAVQRERKNICRLGNCYLSATWFTSSAMGCPRGDFRGDGLGFIPGWGMEIKASWEKGRVSPRLAHMLLLR